MKKVSEMLLKWAKPVLVFGTFTTLSAPSLFAAPACGDSVTAAGKVFYVVPEGNMVAREVSLSVPACGQGAVVISSASGWSVETEAFFVKKIHDRTIFYVAFQDPMGDDAHKFLLFKGTYLRGTNVAGYWGDMYDVVLPEGKIETPADAEKLAKMEEDGSVHHIGGFAFHAGVKAP